MRARELMAKSNAYAVKYRARHGKRPDFSTGVDNVVVADVERHENCWQKIIRSLGDPAGER
jgi:hypothetical protein